MADGMRIEYVALSDLHRHPRNPKAHDLGALHTSVNRFGYVAPVLIDERTGYLVAGHGRLDTLAQMKSDGKEPPARIEARSGDWYVPVVRGVTFNSDAEVEAYLVADNRLTELGGWDEPELAALLQSLADEDEALLEATGYDADDLQALLDELTPPIPAEDAGAQIDRAAELAAKYGTALGQVWKLGRHRLACIDCTDETQVKTFIDGVNVSMVFADPPYGINIVAANGYVGGGEAYDIPFGGVKSKRLGSANGAKPFGSKAVRGSVGAANIVDVGKYAPVIGDETTDTAIKAAQLTLSLFPDAVHFWWGGNYYANALPPSACWVVWDKENTGNFADVELAWTNQDKAARLFRHMWNGMVKASENGKRRVHPTQKPVALAAWCFQEFGAADDVILDPFAGSGISIMAAEQLSRTVYAIELSPDYVAVIIDRWEAATGQTARLVDGP